MSDRVGEPIRPISVSKLTQTRSPAGLGEIRPGHATCGAERSVWYQCLGLGPMGFTT